MASQSPNLKQSPSSSPTAPLSQSDHYYPNPSHRKHSQLFSWVYQGSARYLSTCYYPIPMTQQLFNQPIHTHNYTIIIFQTRKKWRENLLSSKDSIAQASLPSPHSSSNVYQPLKSPLHGTVSPTAPLQPARSSNSTSPINHPSAMKPCICYSAQIGGRWHTNSVDVYRQAKRSSATGTGTPG
jgi:hypothetical protein